MQNVPHSELARGGRDPILGYVDDHKVSVLVLLDPQAHSHLLFIHIYYVIYKCTHILCYIYICICCVTYYLYTYISCVTYYLYTYIMLCINVHIYICYIYIYICICCLYTYIMFYMYKYIYKCINVFIHINVYIIKSPC